MSESYADLLRRAAEQMRADAKVYRGVTQDEGLRLTTADLLEAIADDMDEYAGTEERDGLAGVAALVGTAFRPSKPWTAALAAARAYLGEA